MPILERPLVVPWIRLDRDAAAEEALALRRAREPWLAGFCLFGGEAPAVRRLTERLRDAAARRIFVASDMERGAGQQVRGLRVLPDAAVWGLAATPAEAEAFGALTARDARSVGVDVLFAPVLDVRSEPANPIVGNRSFGWDPDRVAALGAAFVRGALAGGCAPTAKHWPGHGATTADSHDAVPVVGEPSTRLEQRDLPPFAASFAAGCPAAMTAHVAYPSLDATGSIATFSAPLVARLREQAEGLRREVVVFTDALLMAGALGAGGETEAARRALEAGCDALLIPSDPERLAAEVLDGARPGLSAQVERAAATLAGLAVTVADLDAPAGAPAGAATPRRVVDRALALQGGESVRRLRRGEALVVLDDDATGDRGLVLSARAREAGVATFLVRLERGKPSTGVPLGTVPAAVVVMASVRAWKGTPGVSAAAEAMAADLWARSRGRAERVWLAPRAPSKGLHLPGTGPDVEAALADLLLG